MGKFQFSNFHSFDDPLVYQGISYWTVEHFYQAMKVPTENKSFRLKVSHMTPAQARRAGRRVELRSDWEDIKLQVMMSALQHKFQPNTLWAKRLLQTGEIPLVEYNLWHDVYWGKCRCRKCQGLGENMLGKMIMAIRDRLCSSVKI